MSRRSSASQVFFRDTEGGKHHFWIQAGDLHYCRPDGEVIVDPVVRNRPNRGCMLPNTFKLCIFKEKKKYFGDDKWWFFPDKFPQPDYFVDTPPASCSKVEELWNIHADWIDGLFDDEDTPPPAAPAVPKAPKEWPDLMNVSYYTPEQMQGLIKGMNDDKKQANRLVFHFTTGPGLEGIKKDRFLSATMGQGGEGVSVTDKSPAHFRWDNADPNKFFDACGPALWGDGYALDPERIKPKMKRCLVLQIPDEYVTAGRVPDRQDAIVIPKRFLDPARNALSLPFPGRVMNVLQLG